MHNHVSGSVAVTFGDESAVTSNTIASVVSVILIFVLWGAFTGSRLLPSFMHAPPAFEGTGTFTYTITTPSGESDDATVTVVVHPRSVTPEVPEVEPGDGIAKNDATAIASYRSELLRVDSNDEMGRDEETFITAVNGQPISPGVSVPVEFGQVVMSQRGTLNIVPDTGIQMES
ncbi:MAG: ABC transporter permease, partial [Pseudomonadota bacterium]